MSAIQSDAEGAINTFIEDQKKAPGRATFTLVQFDSRYEIVYENVDIQTVGRYALKPRGMTALLDAWGQTINSVGSFLDGLPEEQKPATVTIVIVTDGFENSSREFTAAQIKEMTEHQRSAYNWEFVFLAANQDAVQTAAQYGVSRGSAMTYDPGAVGKAYAAVSAAVTQRRAGGQSVAFTQEDRDAGLDGK